MLLTCHVTKSSVLHVVHSPQSYTVYSQQEKHYCTHSVGCRTRTYLFLKQFSLDLIDTIWYLVLSKSNVYPASIRSGRIASCSTRKQNFGIDLVQRFLSNKIISFSLSITFIYDQIPAKLMVNGLYLFSVFLVSQLLRSLQQVVFTTHAKLTNLFIHCHARGRPAHQEQYSSSKHPLIFLCSARAWDQITDLPTSGPALPRDPPPPDILLYAFFNLP